MKEKLTRKNYYEILGLSERRDLFLTQEAIDKAYIKRSRETKPEFKSSEYTPFYKFEVYAEVNEAYLVLSNPEDKRNYDQTGIDPFARDRFFDEAHGYKILPALITRFKKQLNREIDFDVLTNQYEFLLLFKDELTTTIPSTISTQDGKLIGPPREEPSNQKNIKDLNNLIFSFFNKVMDSSRENITPILNEIYDDLEKEITTQVYPNTKEKKFSSRALENFRKISFEVPNEDVQKIQKVIADSQYSQHLTLVESQMDRFSNTQIVQFNINPNFLTREIKKRRKEESLFPEEETVPHAKKQRAKEAIPEIQVTKNKIQISPSPANWPKDLGDNYSLSNNQYQEIRKLAQTLEREIKSFWPYPHKDRKQIKINAMHALITNILTDPKQPLQKQVEKIEMQYPESIVGKPSRVKKLFDEIKNSKPEEDHKLSLGS